MSILLPSYQLDQPDGEDGDCSLQAGVDEVARGCLFGPVYAAAVILNPNEPLHKWLNDSKKVTPKRRAVVREWIEETALAWSVASVSNDVIDTINIRNAVKTAMNAAIAHLKITPTLLLIDGDHFEADGIDIIPHITIVGGDAKYANIAAASILAKEHHDEFIRNLVAQNDCLECYDLIHNVGYGTPKHIHAIRQYGVTEYHRKTFLRNICATDVGNKTGALIRKTATGKRSVYLESDEL